MVIEQALITYLLTQTGLTASVSNRIHLLKLPQDPVLPAIVIQKISSPRLHGFTADIGATTRMQLTSWATTYTSASAVFEQLRASLQNYLNGTMSTLTVSAVILDDENDTYEDETQRFGKIADFIFWHTEA
jgi:hypothetical protein